MESPIAAMESGRPFVRAELGLAANPMTKTTNMMTAGTRRSDTGDTSLEAADPGGLLPARDMMNHCVEYAERYSSYRQESTGRSSIGGWQRNRPTSRGLGHRRHAESVERGSSPLSVIAAGQDQRARPLVATPGRVQRLGQPDQRRRVSDQEGRGSLDHRGGDRVRRCHGARVLDARLAALVCGEHGGLGPQGGVPGTPLAVVPEREI